MTYDPAYFEDDSAAQDAVMCFVSANPPTTPETYKQAIARYESACREAHLSVIEANA